MNIDGPNNLIYKFDGNLEVPSTSQLLSSTSGTDMDQIPLSNDNVLLRGMSLRNTESVIGIVVYTGHETKIQMNTVKSGYKVSKMMGLTNVAIFWIFILQILFSISGATVSAYWTVDNEDNPYLGMHYGDENIAQQDISWIIFTMAGSWILIFCNFVPISLLVTLEMVKFFQGSFMDWDIDMFDFD